MSSAPSPEGFDLVAVGYWVDKGMPDLWAYKYLETIRNSTVALFGTLGAWPDSDHAMDCKRAGEALVSTAEQGNRVLGTFLCQGKIDPKVVALMAKKAVDLHPMTADRRARIAEAENHPNTEDCRRAQESFRVFAERAGVLGPACEQGVAA